MLFVPGPGGFDDAFQGGVLQLPVKLADGFGVVGVGRRGVAIATGADGSGDF